MSDRDNRQTPPPVREPCPRQTSFASSFFQAGDDPSLLQLTTSPTAEDGQQQQQVITSEGSAGNNNNTAADGNNTVFAPRVTRPPSMVRRTSSNSAARLAALQTRRASSSHQRTRSGALSLESMAAALQQQQQQQPNSAQQQQQQQPTTATTTPPNNNNTLLPRLEPLQRHPSWFVDAMNQGQGMSEKNLREFLGVSANAEEEEGGLGSSCHADEGLEQPQLVDDQELLEQYRIMAQHEARQLFKEKVGCTVEEYMEKRRLGRKNPPAVAPDETTKEEEYWKRAPLPPLSAPSTESWLSDTAENLPPSAVTAESSIPMPEFPPLSELFTEKLEPTDELQTGTILFRETMKLGVGDKGKPMNIVRCLSCKSHLQVDPLATLVSCPSCSTVSPNCSTRR